MNDLDKAILAFSRSQAALPDLMRALAAGERWFFVPFHPEIEGQTMELENGMALPFTQIEDPEGPLVLMFSSEERAKEALATGRFAGRTLSIASAPSKVILEILGKMNLRAVLNKSCKTGELILPANLLRDVADGSAFEEEEETGEPTSGTLNIVDPADYPTKLIQAAFELLRKHPNFRAAWIFRRPEADEKDAPSVTRQQGQWYQFLVLMDPRDPKIFRDLNLVVQGACDPPDQVDIGHLPEDDLKYVASLWDLATPFYTAAGYKRP